MRLYSYIVARDFGFAPNPFHGCCTLATCKPQIRASASVGDWIIGTGAKTKYRLTAHLIYAMTVDEVITFEAYWQDVRFSRKATCLERKSKATVTETTSTTDPTASGSKRTRTTAWPLVPPIGTTSYTTPVPTGS